MGLLSLLTLGKRTMQGVSQGFPWGSLFLAVWPCEIRPSLMAWSWVYSSVCEGQLQVHWLVYLKLVGTNSRQQATAFRHQISCLERHSEKQYKDIDYLKVAHWLFFTGSVTSWPDLFSWRCSAVWYFLYYWLLDGSHLATVTNIFYETFSQNYTDGGDFKLYLFSKAWSGLGVYLWSFLNSLYCSYEYYHCSLANLFLWNDRVVESLW